MLTTIFIGAVTIFGSFPGIDYLIKFQNYAIINLRNLLIILISILVGIILINMNKKYKSNISNHRLNFMIRDEQLRRMYKRLIGLDKRKLNREFESVKKDYQSGKIKLPYS